MTQDLTAVGPLPRIGYGTWNRDGQEAYEGVLRALEVGYRHVDTAEGYHNEEFVGRALTDSGVPRDEIFLTTKVAPENLGPGQVMPHARASLDRLGTDRVDLLLIHWPSIRDEFDIADYMGQLAEVQDGGLTRHIGVSNFTKRHIDRAVEVLGDRPIATNQCEIHVLMQNHPIVKHCAARGIPMTAYKSPGSRTGGRQRDAAGGRGTAQRHGRAGGADLPSDRRARRHPALQQARPHRVQLRRPRSGAEPGGGRGDPEPRRGTPPRGRRLGTRLGRVKSAHGVA